MGFANRSGGKYFTVYQGKFAIKVEKGTPGSTTRINKMNKETSEIYHDSFTGKLIDIRTRDGEYGKTWEFDFRDGKEVYTLSLPYSNGSSTTILKILPNVDLTKEMKLQVSQKEEDGKKKTSLFISQDGTTLKHAFTKAEPNGIPPMEQKTVKGQTVWDDTDRLVFLEAMVNEKILPQLPRDGAAAPTAPAAGEVDDFGDPLGGGETGGDDDF